MTDGVFSLKPTFSSGKLTDAELLEDMSVDQVDDVTAHCPRTPLGRDPYHDFDDLLSSSPVAQSTPRIRLEPSFDEFGKKTLKNVPADAHSLFDNSDMDVDDEPPDNTSKLPPS